MVAVPWGGSLDLAAPELRSAALPRREAQLHGAAGPLRGGGLEVAGAAGAGRKMDKKGRTFKMLG